jgi:hypothetical protein
MVLAYWGIEHNQAEIAQTMDIFPGIGVPGSRIKRLASRQLDVLYGEGELADLQTAVAQNIPPIALVSTAELPYWDISTPHAIVITGIDENSVWMHDPAKIQPNIEVSIGDFLLAWDVMMNLYALLRKV